MDAVNIHSSCRWVISGLVLFSFLVAGLHAEPVDYAIVANAPGLNREVVQCHIAGRRVVALDGAADQLNAIGVIPDVILGDFDSIADLQYWGISTTCRATDDSASKYLGRHGVWIVPAGNQDYTDLEKGIQYCDENEALSIIVLNVVGGRMDHTLWNTRCLRRYYQADRPLKIVTESQTLEYVRDVAIDIVGAIGDVCAVMAFPEACVTTDGLKWDVTDFALVFGESESVCNLLERPRATVVVAGEALVIGPGTRPSVAGR